MDNICLFATLQRHENYIFIMQWRVKQDNGPWLWGVLLILSNKHFECRVKFQQTTFWNIFFLIFLEIGFDTSCKFSNLHEVSGRGHPRAFREGEVLRHVRNFREKFWSKFGFLYRFYTFSLLPELKIGRSQPAWKTFSPKSPSRVTPGQVQFSRKK